MSWIHYLLEANLYLVAFYLLYYLLLSRETYYQLNRVYLLVSTVPAFIIPLIRIGVLNPPVARLRNMAITTIDIQPVITSVHIKTAFDTSWPLIDYFLLGYALIVILLLVNFMVKIYKLIRLSHRNKTAENEAFKLVELPDENNAFSFFNYLYVSPGLTLSSTIINHELIHIRQKHSWDIIYLELLKIINWFNPFLYLLQNSMKEVHEFIADSQTVDKEPSADVYTDFLVNNAYGIHENMLTNTFFNKSLLKKRIMMLHQKRSGNAARLKYLFVLPLIGGLLCASTLGFTKTYALVDLAPRHELPISVPHHKNKADTVKKDFLNKAVTSKGYKYQETAYLINRKTNFRVIIIEKNGTEKEYYKNSASTADLKLLKDKYGYTFPSMAIFDKMPPPPPAPMGPPPVRGPIPPVKVNFAPPPPPAPPVKVKLASPPPPAQPVKIKLAPPPPQPAPPKDAVKFPPPSYWDNNLKNLAVYLWHYVLYPTEARDSKITGNVIAQITVNSDHRITDAKIISGIGHGCDDEVVKVLKAYEGTINKTPGDYVLAITFNLVGNAKIKTYFPEPVNAEISGKPNFVGSIQTYSYL